MTTWWNYVVKKWGKKWGKVGKSGDKKWGKSGEKWGQSGDKNEEKSVEKWGQSVKNEIAARTCYDDYNWKSYYLSDQLEQLITFMERSI